MDGTNVDTLNSKTLNPGFGVFFVGFVFIFDISLDYWFYLVQKSPGSLILAPEPRK
jgi:hypothetical protein